MLCFLVSTSAIYSNAQNVSVNTDGASGPALFNVGNTVTPPFRINSTGQVLGWNINNPSTPAYSFVDNDNTGIYRPAINSIGFSIGGTERMLLNSSGVLTLNQLSGTGNRLVYANASGDLVVNSTISKVDPFYIRGTGLNNNADRAVRIGNANIPIGNGRGLNLVVISKATHAIVSNVTYDCYGDPAASNNLAIALNALNNSQIGILTSYDAWEGQITVNLQNAFLRLGLYKAYRTTVGASRRPYAAIFEAGSAGVSSAHVAEVEFSDNGNQPYAELRGWLVDGGFVGTTQVPSGLSTPIGTPALTINESAQIFVPNLAGSGNRAVFVDGNGMLKAGSKNATYVVDRAERGHSNANSGFITISNSTGNLAVENGDIVFVNVSLKFAFTGGSNNDDVRFRLGISGCVSTTDAETYEFENFDNDRNEYQGVNMQFVYVATCSGNIQFYLQMDHNSDADDAAKTGDVVITAVKY